MKADEPGVVLFRFPTAWPLVLTKVSIQVWLVAVKVMPRNESNGCSMNWILLIPPRMATSTRAGGAWAGSTEVGQKHYYRVQGTNLLIEYDNTQNDGNHIHTIWRDPERDFGRDLLAQHYADAH